MDTTDQDSKLAIVDALVVAMGGPVFVLQFFAVALLVVLAAVGYGKGRSIWSLIEMFLLIGGYGMCMLGLTQLHVSFPEFLVTKLVASTVCFGIETLLVNSKKLALPPLTYLMGTSRDMWHAGVTVGSKYYHSAFPRHSSPTATDVDPSWELTPQVLPRAPHAHTLRTVGVAYANIDDATILQRLDLSGRCHDWAGNSVYTLSADKFMSYSLIAWLRWLNWIGAAVFFLLALVGGLPCARAAVDVLAISFTLLDVVNLRANQLAANRKQAAVGDFTRSCAAELLKLALHVALFLALSLLWRASFWKFFEFHIYLLVSYLLSTFLHFVYFPARLQSRNVRT